MSEDEHEHQPLWRQVLEDLERRIAQGDIVERFPTDRELTEHYGVSRHTVREAVRRLRARGLVDRHRGRGSFLNEERLTQPLGGMYSLFEAVEAAGLERLRYAGDAPLALDQVWLPADVGRPLLDVDFRRTALYTEFRERCGLRVTDADEMLEPVVPDDDAADLLQLDAGEALLRVRRLGRADGRPVECRISLIRGQRFLYTHAWRTDERTTPATSFTAAR